MSRRRGWRSAVAAAAAAALLLAASGCGGSDPDTDSGAPVEMSGSGSESGMTGSEHDPYPVADTPLTTADGEPYSLATDTTKPLTLVFFGYTNCPTECPIVMNTLASAMPRLSEEDRAAVDVVFVTTDPERDTEGVLTDYLARYDPGFIGLTGDLEDIVTVADSMKMFVAEGEKLPSGGYDLTAHSTYVSAVQDGGATVIWNMETSPAALAEDIHTLLEESR